MSFLRSEAKRITSAASSLGQWSKWPNLANSFNRQWEAASLAANSEDFDTATSSERRVAIGSVCVCVASWLARSGAALALHCSAGLRESNDEGNLFPSLIYNSAADCRGALWVGVVCAPLPLAIVWHCFRRRMSTKLGAFEYEKTAGSNRSS